MSVIKGLTIAALLSPGLAYAQVRIDELPSLEAGQIRYAVDYFHVRTGAKWGQSRLGILAWDGPRSLRYSNLELRSPAFRWHYRDLRGIGTMPKSGAKAVTFAPHSEWSSPSFHSVEELARSLPLSSFSGLTSPGKITTPDGSELTASVNARGETTKISVRNPSHMNEGTWSFLGRLAVKGGGWIPLTATFRLPDGVVSKRITFIEADSHTPPTENLEFPWYKPALEVTDRRVDPAIGWSYDELVAASGKKKGLTPEELYELSLQRAKKIRPTTPRKITQPAITPLTDLWKGPVIIFAVVLGVGLASYALSRRTRKSK